MKNKNVKELVNGFSKYDIVKNGIEAIIKKYEIKYFNDHGSYKIDFHNYLSDVEIAVTFQTNNIPFGVIRDINNYLDIDCSRIVVSAGHYISLIYSFEKNV